MPAQDFELILRVQADLQTAVGELRTLNDQMRVIKSSAQEASGGLQNLTSRVRGVGDQIKSLGGSMSAAASHLRALAGAALVAVAIREVAKFVENVINADQAIGDMAQKVGVSTETISALGNVAKRSGSDLQGVQNGFVNLARAATGLNKQGVLALQAMNINLKQFRDLSPERQFDLVAQKFAGYSDGANKAALATALFGKTGADLIPTLNQVGQQGLQKITAEAIAAGTAVGHDAVNASQAFSNALQILKEKLQGAVNQGLVTFTPEIQRLSDLISSPEFQHALQGLIQEIAESGDRATIAAGKLADFIDKGQQILGFSLDRNVSGAFSNKLALSQLAVDRDELARREAAASAPDSGYLDSAANISRVARGVFSPDRGLRTTLASAEDLRKEIAKLSEETNAYAKARQSANKTEPNPQAGDMRGLFVGEGGKTTAPVIDPDAARKAAELAKQAAQAQAALTQSLIDLQGQLDPTAAVYAKYDDAVQKATDEAALAKKAHGADAAAIDLQRDAVIALAAKVRDAALDQLAEKDREAWDALRRSFETPAEVRVEDALTQIAKLNDLLKKGIVTSSQYRDALGEIGQKSVAGALPTYQGVGAAVGGPYGELQKNYQAQTALDTAYQAQKLALDKKFNDADEAQHAAHMSALAALDEDCKNKNLKIEQSRGQLQLTATSNLFGQLATLSSSHNKKLATIGKAAAAAQALVNTYESATEAYAAMASIPYIGPALGIAAAAAAVAAGLANVAQIRSQPVGGYAGGGRISGPGSGTSDSVPILASNGEYMQREAAVRYYGVDFMDAVNKMQFPRFADGGLFAPHPLANAPSPAALGFATPRALPIGAVAGSAANDATGGERGGTTHIHVWSVEEAAEKIAALPTFEKAVVHVVQNNPRKIRGKWGR